MDPRILHLRKLLKKNSLDAILISSLPNIAYFTNFSGFTTLDRDAFLLITSTKQYIFTHGIYKEAVQKNIKHFELIEIKRENPISSLLKEIVAQQHINHLGFEAFDLKVSEYQNLVNQIDQKLLKPTNIVSDLRVHKTSDEIAAIKNACAIGDKAFSYIITKIKKGITESELTAELEYFIKSQGADISFNTIVAFEENAAYPHHVPTNKRLTDDSFVLLDFGVLYQNYCSDMTRTICFGKASNKKKHIYQTVYIAQQKAIDYLITVAAGKEIIPAANPDKIARDYILLEGFPSMPHSLGHGIGLEVHESPRLTSVSKDMLENGMVFSIEPGIYLPGNTGVRIEDLFAFEGNKLIQLTHSPSKLIEIEA